MIARRFCARVRAVTFQELTNEERLALGGLAHALLGVDRAYSEEEADRAQEVAEELGDPEGFWAAVEQAQESIASADELRAITLTVTRAEARELILDVLESLAAAETMTPAEQKMLDELRGLWGIPAPTAE